MTLFSAIMSICATHFPYDSLNVENRKIGNFQFLNPIYGAQITCQPHCFLLSCVQYLYLHFNLFAQWGQTLFEESKGAKKYDKKFGQNDRKFQNISEVFKWQYNSVGEIWSENEIQDLLPFEPLFPLSRHRDFYCQIEILLPNSLLHADHFYDIHDK